MTGAPTQPHAPPPDAVTRFRADCARIAGADAARLGIAVSGGPDSLALLLLAAAAFPGQIAVGTVDHGLRPEAAGEAEFVARLCAAMAVPHATLTVTVAKGREGVQGEARRARYAALAEWAGVSGFAFVATAHHADDQAETLLMRLMRGSGLAGLSGVRAARPLGSGVSLIRPLLTWRREELAAIVAGAGIHPVDDPANRDPRFDRARIRHFLVSHPEFEAERIARSATAIAEANAALDWAVDAIAAERLVPAGKGWTLYPASLPREMRRRLLRRAIAAIHAATPLTPAWTGSEDVDGLLAALEAGGAGTLAGVMAKGGESWRIALAPPRRAGA